MEGDPVQAVPPPGSDDERQTGQNSPSATPPVSKTAHINFELLSKYFHLPMKEVALELGVCTTMLKRLCRNHGIPRWPFRQIKSINRMIKSMEKTKESKSADSQRILKALEKKRRLLLTQPQPSTTPPVPENPRVKKITQYTFVPTSDAQAPMEIVSEVHNVPSPEEEVVVPPPPSSEPSPPFIFAPPTPHSFNFKASACPTLPAFTQRAQGFSGAQPHASAQSEAALRQCLAEIQQFIQHCDELYKQGKSEGSFLHQSQQQLLAQQQQEQLIHRTFVSLRTLQDQLSGRLRQPGAIFDSSEQTLVAQQLHRLRAQLQASVRSPQQLSSPSQQESYAQRQTPSAAAAIQLQQQQHQRQVAMQQQQQQQIQQQQLFQQQQQQQILAQRSLEHERRQQQREEEMRCLEPLSHSQMMPTKRSVSDASTDYMDEEPDTPSQRNSWSKETFRQSMRQEIEQQHQLYIEKLHRESSASRSSSRSPPTRPQSISPPTTPLPMPTTTSSSMRTFNAPHIPRKPASTTTLSSSGSLPRASVHVSRELSPTSLLAARRANTHGVMKSPPERRMPDVMELASSNFLTSHVSASPMDCSSSHSRGCMSSRDFSRMESPSSSSMRGFGRLESTRSFSEMGFGDRSPMAVRDHFHPIKLPELKLPEEHRNAFRAKLATLEPTYGSRSPGPS